MTRLRLAPLAAAILAFGTVSASPASAQQVNADSVVSSCTAADTATQWKQVAAAWAADSAKPPANPQLRDSLLALADSDQAVRMIPGFADSIASATFRGRLMARDSADAAALMEIVAHHGWPTRTMVGADGASAAFLIAQHNASIQHEALRLMLALPPGEVSPSDLALLQDRVLTGDGKPQRYGTQLAIAADGKPMTFDPIEDPAHVDERRARVGLPPLDVYICIMRGMYGREVVDPRAGTGR